LSQNITEDIMTMTYNDDALKWTHIVVEVALNSSPLNKATSVICLYGRPVVFWRISHTHTHTIHSSAADGVGIFSKFKVAFSAGWLQVQPMSVTLQYQSNCWPLTNLDV